MTVVPQQCAWSVVRCCVPRATAVRQSLRGPPWGRLQNTPTNVGAERASSSGTGLVEPQCEKTGLQGFRRGATQMGLCSHRKVLESLNLEFKKKRDCSIGVAKTKALFLRLPRSWSAPLFLHRQKSSFLMMRLS